MRPNVDIPRYAGMYRNGVLDLDALVSEEYTLAEIGAAVANVSDGERFRNVVTPT